MEGAPTRLDVYQLCSEIEDEEGVTLVHDVHTWTITTGYNALAAHVLIDPAYQGDIEELMRRLRRTVRQQFGIQHITLQMEQSATDCSEHHHVGHLEARSQLGS